MLQDTKELIDELIFASETSTPMKIASLEARLTSHLPTSASNGDWIYESCRLTSLLLLHAIENHLPLSALDTSALNEALRKTDLGDNWGDMLGVLAFVSLMEGGKRCVAVVLKLVFDGEEGFGAAVRGVRRFGRVVGALNSRAEGVPLGDYKGGSLRKGGMRG